MSKRGRNRRKVAIVSVPEPAPAPPVAPIESDQALSLPSAPEDARWAALTSLEKAVHRESLAVAARDRSVERAREAGATWVEIGRALGVTRQAVRQRYASPSITDG